jgi:shikimate dehydrogenase
MIESGLIGYPLGHSLSPQLHQAAFKALGLEGRYRLFPIAPMPEGEAPLRALLETLRAGDLDGLNVTIPHKQAVIPWLDELSPVAQAVGAVNTLFRRGNRLCGDNTDVPGFLADLRSVGVDPTLADFALVLGAGGSARAVVYALLQSGWAVTLAARRPGVTLGYAGQSISAVPLTLQALRPLIKDCRLIVNTTPVGMTPQVDASPWPEDLPFPPGAAVYDLVYNPPVTRLVQQARQAGRVAGTGLGMLVEQAALSFERWVGQAPSIQAMRQAVDPGNQEV